MKEKSYPMTVLVNVEWSKDQSKIKLGRKKNDPTMDKCFVEALGETINTFTQVKNFTVKLVK